MTTTGIIDISNVLSTGYKKRTVKHQLSKIKTGSEQERSILFELIAWLNTDGDDIIELIKIVMKLVNPLKTDGRGKKKEAKFLFIQVIKLLDIDDADLPFYTNIFESAVEVIVWAKKGGLGGAAKKSGCFPCLKK